jgi:hypothetical protein
MGRRRLVCHVVPPEQVRSGRIFVQPKKPKRAEPVRTLDRMRAITARLLEREKLQRQRLADLGIDYDFPGYAAAEAAVETSNERQAPVAAATIDSGNSLEPSKRKATPHSDVASSKSRRRTESLSSLEPGGGPGGSEKSRKKKRKDSDASPAAGEGKSQRESTASGKVAPSEPGSGAKKARKESDASLNSLKSADESMASPPGRPHDSTSPAEKASSGKKKHKSKRKDSHGSDTVEERAALEVSPPEKPREAPPPPGDRKPQDHSTSPAEKASSGKKKHKSKRKDSHGGDIAEERPALDVSPPEKPRAAPLPPGDREPQEPGDRRSPTSEKKKKKDKKKRDKDRRASVP